MTFWSGNRLADQADKIVKPTPQVDCSAYALTVGREAYVTHNPGSSDGQDQKVYLSKQEQENSMYHLRYRTTILIPSGQFAFLLTEQDLDIPFDAMGFISLRSGPKFKGLINVSGFHVDPGFKGKLIYAVYNAGPNTIHLERGDDIFRLWMADLSNDASLQYSRNKPPQTQISSELITNVSAEIVSLHSLSSRIDILSDRVGRYAAVATAISILLALLLAALAIPGVLDRWGSNRDQITGGVQR